MPALRRNLLVALLAGSALAVGASRMTVAEAAPTLQGRCSDAFIRSPQQGDTLQGAIPVYGSARIDDFNFYKVEYAPAENPDDWAAVSSTKPAPVVGGVLDIWNTQSVPDGRYYVKLTVVDSVSQEICRSTVGDLYVANEGTPTPTATPTPEESPTPTESVEAPSGASTAEATATPEPTVEPIIPSEGTSSLLSPSGLLDALQLGDLLGAFLRGFATVFVIGLILAFVAWLRNG